MKKISLTLSIIIFIIYSVLFTGCKSDYKISSIQEDNPQYVKSRSYFPTKEWKTSTPQEQGVSEEKIALLKKDINKLRLEGKKIDGIIIVKNGCIIMEDYSKEYNKNTPHGAFSCAKSITSSLVGIAINKGYIKGVDEKAMNYFSDFKITNKDSKKQNITIKHLLTMTSGMEWYEWETTKFGNSFSVWEKSSNPLNFVLNVNMINEPGKVFNYNTGNTHMLSYIIEKSTGVNILEFARKNLFEPLGFKNYTWKKDNAGLYYGGTYIYLTPRDMAKFGFLYLNKGNWDGKQIVSKEWIDESLKEQIQLPKLSKGYGYNWWNLSANSDNIKYDIHAAVGYSGQRIFIIPKLDMVVVCTNSILDKTDEWMITDSFINNYIIPATVN